jgi:hypothetical protein
MQECEMRDIFGSVEVLVKIHANVWCYQLYLCIVTEYCWWLLVLTVSPPPPPLQFLESLGKRIREAEDANSEVLVGDTFLALVCIDANYRNALHVTNVDLTIVPLSPLVCACSGKMSQIV